MSQSSVCSPFFPGSKEIRLGSEPKVLDFESLFSDGAMDVGAPLCTVLSRFCYCHDNVRPSGP